VFLKVNRKILRIHHAEQPQKCQPNFNTRPPCRRRLHFASVLFTFHAGKRKWGKLYFKLFKGKKKKKKTFRHLGRGGHIEN
jgi:hypothetical protein